MSTDLLILLVQGPDRASCHGDRVCAKPGMLLFISLAGQMRVIEMFDCALCAFLN